jgi:thiol-disulfide isomerase/thioredoxin
MRALCGLLSLVILCACSTGCAIFGKKEGSAERSSGLSWFKKKDTSINGPAPAKFPDPLMAPAGIPPPAPTPTPTAQNPNPAEIALLAGRVVDSYNRPTNNTYVRLVNLEGNKEGATPIDVATSSDGYFTIPNLKSGGQYQLIARTKQGEKLLAGITYTQAPNVRVVIQVKEEFATSSIPPLPASTAPAAQDKRDDRPVGASEPNKGPAGAAWAPSPASTTSTPASDLPATLTVPVPTSTTPNKSWPPMLQIGPKKATTPPGPASSPPKPPALPVPIDLQSGLAPKVPSCVLVGEYLQALALNDVNGQTWNFHKDRKGKLVLLDFSTANCKPCEKMMPVLSQLQAKFGPQGLEVIGVALDTGAVKDQAERARKLCHTMQTNYRQVLGQDDQTNLRSQFNLPYFPFLILLDQDGRIVWRQAGLPPDQTTLELVIQKHLAGRAF